MSTLNTYNLKSPDSANTNLALDASGNVAIQAGSASAPSVYVTGDANTGLYSPGADQVALTTGGTARLYIDSSGRVGIGTTSPTTDLQVYSSVTCTVEAGCRATSGGAVGRLLATYLGGAGGTASEVDLRAGNGYAYLVASTNNPLLFGTNATERARIDSSGRLLVGTSSTPDVAAFGSSGQFFIENTSGFAAMALKTNGSGDNGAYISLCKSRGTGANNKTIVQSGDLFGGVFFEGTDGSGILQGASITSYVDGTPGANDMPGRLVFSTTADGASSPTERMRINSAGNIGIGNQINNIGNYGNTGVGIGGAGFVLTERSQGPGLLVNRTVDDGELVQFAQAGTLEGTISVSGTTVSYNGAHLSRWSQLSGVDPYNKTVRPQILRGTVMSNLDEMCDWTCPTSGDCQDNEQLNKTKISDVEGDKNVAGVFQGWDDDDDTWVNDFYLAMTGDLVIRIAAGTTVQRGDLLMSAGDGTAKPQDDDIIRSKTIAKVTSTNVSCTHPDGSYCVPCVLMAC